MGWRVPTGRRAHRVLALRAERDRTEGFGESRGEETGEVAYDFKVGSSSVKIECNLFHQCRYTIIVKTGCGLAIPRLELLGPKEGTPIHHLARAVAREVPVKEIVS